MIRLYLFFLSAGKGVISVLSNVAPQETHDGICEKYLTGDVKGSCAEQLRALPLINQLFCDESDSGEKAMNLMGMDVGGLRMPLTKCRRTRSGLVKAMKSMV